jgi:hypothetical protein
VLDAASLAAGHMGFARRVIDVLRIVLFRYWINTYSGGGSVVALGGALLVGGLPRLIRTNRMRDSLLMAIGLCVLVLSRPYEGLLLCLPAGFVLTRWIFSGPTRPTARLVFRSRALPLAPIVAVVAWLDYYDYCAFGNPATLPYSVDRTIYAAAPYWIWQSPLPEQPPYRQKALRDFYVGVGVGVELSYARRLHTVSGLLSETLLAKPLSHVSTRTPETTTATQTTRNRIWRSARTTSEQNELALKQT